MKVTLSTFLSALFMASTCLGSTPSHFEAPIAMYNRINTGTELVNLIFSYNDKYTPDDKKFIAELKKDIEGEVLPKAKVTGKTIFLEKSNTKIEILSATSGEYMINGKTVKLSPSRPLRTTFKEIENALSTTQSKYEFFFVNRAEAAGPVAIAAAAVYGLGAIVTGGTCATLGLGFGGLKPENLAKVGRVCSEVAVAWPYAAWSFYDDIQNSHEVIEGSCEKNGPNNQFGNLVKLRTRDDLGKRYLSKEEKELEIYKKEYYFKTDEKTGKVRVFLKGYDSKNNTYDQVHEPTAYENMFLNINDQEGGRLALTSYIKNLEEVCAKGGTAALNKLIKSDSKVSNGLINIAKLDPSKNSSKKSNKTGENSTSGVK